jgi:hypothetical protein
MANNFKRTTNVPIDYTLQPRGATARYLGCYIGFVRANGDALNMGRLQVWIPDLSTNDEDSLFTVSYCSPFAGASPLTNVTADSTTSSQTSYGFWAVPPDVGNEVIIQFINGDPNRGIWIGCLYQQFMNAMVPGIPSGPTAPSNGQSAAPLQEYNKKDSTQSIKENPLAPVYTTLANGLDNEGLTNDPIRGSSTSGAQRDTVPQVLGLLSPAGSQFVMDDDATSEFIRLRTASGTQILVNETVGMVYMISKNGNAWVEISDDGVDIYSANSISLRGQADLNFHADGNINLFGAGGINIATPGGLTMQASGNINATSGSLTNLTSGGAFNVSSQANINISSKNIIGLQASQNIAIESTSTIGITSTGYIYLKGSNVQVNSGQGPQPIAAMQATIAAISENYDRALNGANGYPVLQTKSIVSRLPSHEPWAGHPTSSTDFVSRAVNSSLSTSVSQGSSSGGTMSPSGAASASLLNLPVTTPNQSKLVSAQQAYAYFIHEGWTGPQACGIIANIQNESQFNPAIFGDNGTAYGICQWHPDRQANFAAFTGVQIQGSTYGQQLAFINYELRNGSEQPAGRQLLQTSTANAAGYAMCFYYERPQNKEYVSQQRGALAQTWYGILSTTTSSPVAAPAAATNQSVSLNATQSDGL